MWQEQSTVILHRERNDSSGIHIGIEKVRKNKEREKKEG